MMANAPATPTPSRARWKRLLLWSLAGVLLIPIALGTHDAVLSYNGFCFAQGRYLTDEERIRSAVEAILASYPRITYAYDVLPKPGYEVVRDKTRCCAQGDASRFDGSKGGTAIDASQLIPYRDIEEFFAVNPDCTSRGLPRLWISQHPAHGTTEVVTRDSHPVFPSGNPLEKCNAASVPGVAVTYTPRPGFAGADILTFEEKDLDGAHRSYRIALTVR